MGAPSARTDVTKARLRAAGAACFRERGFQGATTAEIAQRAGVAEATVFVHYSNKLGLLHAVTEEYFEGVQADAERLLEDPALGDGARLEALVSSWTERLAADGDLIQVFIQTAQVLPDSELATSVKRCNRRYTRLVVGVLDRLKLAGRISPDIPSGFARDLIFGVLEHTARGQRYAGKPIDTADAAALVIRLLLQNPVAPTDAERRLELMERKLEQVLDRLGS